MGHSYSGKCLDCGTRFLWNEGGGFFFFFVRCNRCGKEAEVGLDQLQGFGNESAAEGDPYGALRSVGHMDLALKAIIGQCSCGGAFSEDAPPRCPTCRSLRLEGQVIRCFD